jgi:hypothetical protein
MGKTVEIDAFEAEQLPDGRWTIDLEVFSDAPGDVLTYGEPFGIVDAMVVEENGGNGNGDPVVRYTGDAASMRAFLTHHFGTYGIEEDIAAIV